MLTSVEEPLKESDRAYLAGLIDSSGSIFVNRYAKEKGTYYRIRLRLHGLSKPIAEWLKTTFPKSDRSTLDNGVELVTFNSRLALRVLASCFYFLRVKRERARAALEFGQSRREGNQKRSSEELVRQAELAAKLSDINHGRS